MVGRLPGSVFPSNQKVDPQARARGVEGAEITAPQVDLEKDGPRLPDPPLLTTTRERARFEPGADLPPRVRSAVLQTPLGDVLGALEQGGALAGADAAGLLFALRAQGLTRGDFVALRKLVLSRLPKDRAALNKTAAARDGRPEAAHIVQLLLPNGAPRPEVGSLESSQAALAKLDQQIGRAVDRLEGGRGDAGALAELEAARNVQASVVEGFSAWPSARFADQIERFRSQGAAVEPADLGPLQ